MFVLYTEMEKMSGEVKQLKELGRRITIELTLAEGRGYAEHARKLRALLQGVRVDLAEAQGWMKRAQELTALGGRA